MAIHPAELATLRAFVAAAKRDRFVTLFSNPKRRRQALDALNHFASWDSRFARVVDSARDVLPLLQKAGAPALCHVISDSPDLDGREMQLEEAVAACEEYYFASVLCCEPGELAFYFDEVEKPSRSRVLLRRPSGST